MKKEKIIITLLTMALVACLVGGYFIYDNLNQKNKDLSTKTNELEEKKIPLMVRGREKSSPYIQKRTKIFCNVPKSIYICNQNDESDVKPRSSIV